MGIQSELGFFGLVDFLDFRPIFNPKNPLIQRILIQTESHRQIYLTEILEYNQPPNAVEEPLFHLVSQANRLLLPN